MQTLDIEIDLVPFNEIRFEERATPECLEHSEVRSNRTQISNMISMMNETKYREPLKVALVRQKYLLLPPYETYKAWEHVLADVQRYPSLLQTKVPCVVIPFDSVEEMLPLAHRLSSYQGFPKAHLHRLINLQLLTAKAQYTDLKAILGIQPDQASEKRQLQRDLRLLKHRPLLSRVVGLDLRGNDELTLITSLRRGRAIDIDMTAKQAEIYLSKLRDDPNVVDEFLRALDEEKKWIRENFSSPDEETKPFYKRRAFNFHRILRMAENIALGMGYLNDETDEKIDQHWSPKLSHDNGLASVPEAKFSLYDPGTKNLKVLTAVAYNAGQLSSSLKAHIARIRPVQHGSVLKVRRSDLAPSISIHSNHPDLKDISYVHFIRENCMLLYCNRQHFLRCLELQPANFGFGSYRWDETAKSKKIRDAFNAWWSLEFVPSVRRWYSSKEERHPAYQYLIHIRTFLSLEESQNGGKEWFFSDFFNEALAYVFSQIDLAEDCRRNELLALNSLRIRTTKVQWQQIEEAFRKNGKVDLSPDELSGLIEKTIRDLQSSFEATIQMQNHKLSEQNKILRELVDGPTTMNDSGDYIRSDVEGSEHES